MISDTMLEQAMMLPLAILPALREPSTALWKLELLMQQKQEPDKMIFSSMLEKFEAFAYIPRSEQHGRSSSSLDMECA